VDRFNSRWGVGNVNLMRWKEGLKREPGKLFLKEEGGKISGKSGAAP